MSAGDPSFYGLFRRSRYGGSIHTGDDSEEAKRAIEQRERFAVATIGFCLKHDEAFRQHFWRKVCRMTGDPDCMGSLSVEVEPEHWADLRLTAENPGWKLTCIVECKAGAPLDDKQDPNCGEFKKSGVGYGYFITKSAKESRVRHRYIILGANEAIDLPNAHRNSFGEIEMCQKSWRCLLENSPTGSLTTDLFDSLGQLGISSFRMNNASNVQVLAGFGAAADAWEVLSVLGPEVCGFRASYWKIFGEYPAPGHFNLGSFLKRPSKTKGTSKLHIQLFDILKPTGDNVVWVGYETGPSIKPDMFRRSIYFYCSDPNAAEKIVIRLQRESPNCTAFRDGNCVVLASAGPQNINDLEWFESKLKALV